MKIDQATLSLLKANLQAVRNAPWSHVAAQIHYFGEEVHFWFLLKERKLLYSAFVLFAENIQALLVRFDQTEFDCAFYVIEEEYEVLCAYIVDEDLRHGEFLVPLEEQYGSFRKKADPCFWEENA